MPSITIRVLDDDWALEFPDNVPEGWAAECAQAFAIDMRDVPAAADQAASAWQAAATAQSTVGQLQAAIREAMHGAAARAWQRLQARLALYEENQPTSMVQ